MTIAELIRALEAMPQDALAVTTDSGEPWLAAPNLCWGLVHLEDGRPHALAPGPFPGASRMVRF
jgi:hypothetical protein